ncbi:membrane protein insertion efficiency factor YidD [bacterium]|nr:membrane protein insertion efficiency factor YidD [candidate division CSSED10-310 bacterium]
MNGCFRWLAAAVIIAAAIPVNGQLEFSPLRGPIPVPTPSSVPYHAGQHGLGTDVLLGIMKIYETGLRPGMSRGCPCIPSCSHYMVIAVQTHGAFIGTIVGLERLLHETGEIHHGNTVLTPEGYKICDPIDNNTFWWHNQPDDE